MKRFTSWLLMLIWLPLVACAAPAADGGADSGADRYSEGIDYARVNPPLPTEGESGIQVLELFWYGCPHCYQFEPHLAEWLKSKPAAANFVRLPAIFNTPRWRLHAQAFYTAEALGVLDKVHGALFEAMHKEKRKLDTKEELERFFQEQGVDPETFRKTFESFTVQTKTNRAADLTKRSGIEGVPAVVVAGKYRVDASMAGSHRNMIEIINYLVAKEARAPTH